MVILKQKSKEIGMASSLCVGATGVRGMSFPSVCVTQLSHPVKSQLARKEQIAVKLLNYVKKWI